MHTSATRAGSSSWSQGWVPVERPGCQDSCQQGAEQVRLWVVSARLAPVSGCGADAPRCTSRQHTRRVVVVVVIQWALRGPSDGVIREGQRRASSGAAGCAQQRATAAGGARAVLAAGPFYNGRAAGEVEARGTRLGPGMRSAVLNNSD
ncbi:hypothetical protein PLESTM_000112100 [Pleodorina starrii]|nr:hypothetical protein PLESTM_000112100 [Pleodorina starrii]